MPRQVGHGWWIILPVPLHFEHGAVDCAMPNGVRCVVRTLPVPLQSGQTSGVVPGAQPLPLQSGHCSTRPTVTSFLQPKAASSKLTLSWTRMLSPLRGAFGLRLAPPPKPNMSPNISPRSPKSLNPPNPPNPAPPPKPEDYITKADLEDILSRLFAQQPPATAAVKGGKKSE